MRQIKFRGKTLKEGKWIFGNLTEDVKGHYRIQFDVKSFSSVVIPETVGQLICIIPNTSMYVDNSQELYEGDIFTAKDSNTKYVAQYDGYGEYYGISNEGDKYGAYTLRFTSHNIKNQDIKIIGNIHDNPSLLTDK